MSEQDLDWTWPELLRGGIAMFSAFVVMYALSFVEIAMSYTIRHGVDGPILTLFKTVWGQPWKLAAFNMVFVLVVLLMVGAVLGYYGFKWVRRGLRLRRR